MSLGALIMSYGSDHKFYREIIKLTEINSFIVFNDSSREENNIY